MVAKELISGRTVRLWQDALRAAAAPPFDTGPDTLFVAYYASAEIGCHLVLGWDIPANILDLYAEFRNLTNGLTISCGAGLLGAMSYFGLGGIQALEKDSMRELAMRGGPFAARSGQHFWIIVKPTSRRSLACFRKCGRTSTCRER